MNLLSKLCGFCTFIILISSCRSTSSFNSSNAELLEPDTSPCIWGWRYNYHTKTDSTFILGHSFAQPADCFPDQNSDSLGWHPLPVYIKIYNRWGELEYESDNLTKSWLCKSDSVCNVREGKYFYVIQGINRQTYIKQNISGSIDVFHSK
jgi:hypothetical protein